MTAYVLIVRHPDAENAITTQGEVEVIDVDLGSNFDGEPSDREQAWSAREQAARIVTESREWPQGEALSAALAMAEQLREEADKADPPTVMGPDDYHDLGLCPDCEADLTTAPVNPELYTPNGHELGCALYWAQEA